ncbi:MAG: hypothetical protein U1A72_06525 [Sulfuritalea sp.]|nr:hypothetical protein [Sulfuritalea sp.]
MNGKRIQNFWLATQDQKLRSLLRAALTSQGLTPLDIKPEHLFPSAAGPAGVAPEHGSVLLLDLATETIAPYRAAEAIRRVHALPWQPRLLAIAATERSVWANEAAWAKSLSGHAMLPRPTNSVAAFLAALLGQLELGAIDARRLDTHLRVMLGAAEDKAPEALIRRLTGDSAPALAAALLAGGIVADRRFHLRKYPECMVGKDAVGWMSRRYGTSREDAVLLGAALLRSGYLHHVVKEQPFADAEFFYRVAPQGRFDAIPLDAAMAFLRGAAGLVADRAWRGVNFPQCMVGTEAVDAIAAQFRLTRAEATTLGQCLLDLGLLHHVADEHPFVDANLFYELQPEPQLAQGQAAHA